MKQLLVMTLLLLGLCNLRTYADTDLSTLSNALYVKHGATIASRSTADVTVCLKNTTLSSVPACQFDLVLPKGITVLGATKSTARIAEPNNDDHSVSSVVLGDGSVRFVCSSNTNVLYTGNDGEIITITLQASDNVEDGIAQLSITNAEITNMVDGLGVATIIDGLVTTSLTIGNPYDEGYSVRMLPISINTQNESVTANVFMHTATSVTSVSFDITLSNSDFTTKDLIEATSLVSGRGTNSSITSKGNGTYGVTVSKTAGFAADSDIDLVQIKIYSQDEAGTYTIPDGKYQIYIGNVTMSDALQSYMVTPQTVDVTVTSQSTLGDVNGDGSVNIVDVVTLVSHIKANTTSELDAVAADVDGKNGVTVDDVAKLCEMVLGRK